MNTLQNAVGWPTARPEQEAAFWADQAVTGARHVKLLLAAGLVACVLWWPTDGWFLHDVPLARFAFLRQREAAFAILLGALTLTLLPFQSRHVVLIGIIAGAMTCFCDDAALALAGGPDGPWFHFTYGLVLMPLIVALRPSERLLVTAGYAACMMAGYFGVGGWMVRSPLGEVAVSFLVGTTLLSILAGIIADGLRRRLFFTRQELAELNASLQHRVLARTEELRQALVGLDLAREAERTRIGRELHDDFGQQFAGLTYAVDLARLRESSGEPVGGNLVEVKRQMNMLRATTRAILAGMLAPTLEQLGLEAALEHLVARVREREGLECHLTLKLTARPLPAPVAATVFRLTQEALSNAERHSSAHRVDVEIESDAGEVRVVVRDDGAGFDPSGAHAGFGLLGMRERARGLGGSCDVESAAGHGTVIRAALPLSSERRAA